MVRCVTHVSEEESRIKTCSAPNACWTTTDFMDVPLPTLGLRNKKKKLLVAAADAAASEVETDGTLPSRQGPPLRTRRKGKVIRLFSFFKNFFKK